VRRIVAAEYLSLDGVMEDPGPVGEYERRGWTVPYWDDDMAKWQTDQLFASDALLLGRVTYDEFVASWPLRSGDPFTDRMNSLPKFVASTTLRQPLEWNANLLEGDVVDEPKLLSGAHRAAVLPRAELKISQRRRSRFRPKAAAVSRVRAASFNPVLRSGEWDAAQSRSGAGETIGSGESSPAGRGSTNS
jgi:hypothetical protein